MCDTRLHSAKKHDASLPSLARALPSKVTTGTGDGYETTYTYDAQGRKLRAYYRRMWMDVITLRKQQVKSLMTDSRIGGIVSPIRPDTLISMDSIFPAPFPLKQLSLDVRYNGNLMFSGNRITVFNPHGYSTITTNQTTGEITTDRYYYLKDHLGSNRVVFREGGEVVQQNHYYAFGGLTAESTGGTLQSFKFNGKEFDRMLGLDLYDYGARWYDPVGSLGFTTMDPLAEDDYGISPYIYCRDNPVNAIDPDGRKVYLFATKLPGLHIPLATHTFIVVTDNNGSIVRYAAYGPEYNNPLGRDRLSQCYYEQDIKVYQDYFKGIDYDNLKNAYEIPTPKGVTSHDFDTKVCKTIDDFGNNPNIKYCLFPSEDTEGNCNSSSSTILIKSGVTKQKMEDIEDSIPGINTGFQTDKTKPWTKDEQKEAVRERDEWRYKYDIMMK